jgi:ATP-dependent Lhr-like helicase
VFADWFARRGWAPRAHQLAMCEAAREGRDALLIAPTGGGKTLGGFLPSLIALAGRGNATGQRPAVHTLYVSPLKALSVDVARNLMTPVAEMGLPIRIEARTGDTPPARRQRQRANPPDILLTTPEQIALLIASDHARDFFGELSCVIVDEIHALAPGKRGDLLALGLATLRQFAPGVRQVGLSATVKDPDTLAVWLAGTKRPPATIVRASSGGERPVVDILVSRERIPWAGHHGQFATREVYEAITAAKLALVFVNTRSQAELLFQNLWNANEDALPIALHHGSLAVEQRRRVEAAMAAGKLRAVVCTSTLDLGIDWGDVDLVIQMGAPKGASRLTQRIGRANHRMDEPSRAILVPTHRFELLECRAAEEAVEAGELDGPEPRNGALDVLAQHVMGRACGEGFALAALHEEINDAQPYAGLAWEDFERVVDFVARGGYALDAYDRFRRIVRRADGRWVARSAILAQQHRMNVGAIVEAETLSVRLARRTGNAMSAGKRLGEIEEYFIETLTPGDTFLFAGQVLRFLGLSEDNVLTQPTTDDRPAIPYYAGGKFPLSTFLAQRVRQMLHDPASWPFLPKPVQEWIAMQRLVSAIPAPDEMLVETFPRGERFYLVAYPFEGRLAHQTLGVLLTRRLERIGAKPTGFVASDYALAVWGMEPMGGLAMDTLFAPDLLGDDLEEWLAESSLMKRTFRNCALISGMIARKQPGAKKTGRQVLFSTDLIFDVLRQHEPDHVLMQAARADAAEGLLDIRRLSDALMRIQGRILHKALARISPFAVPVMLEVGKESVGGASIRDAVLSEAEEDLVADAMKA